MQFTKHSLLYSLSVIVQVVQAQDIDALLKPCIECHGTNGIATKPATPHLDGQRAVYLIESLRAFNDGTRKTAVPQHKGVAKDAAKAIANHYENQKATRPKSAVDASLLARGEELYLGRCADCHPENGREAEKDAPLMAAQNVDYLGAQAFAFKKGERRFATMMDDAFRGLNEADLTSVAHFFASQSQVAPKAEKKKRRKD